jgi:hypothetical protein
MEYGARAQCCIHSVAMVFPAQFAEGGGARPTPLNSIYSLQKSYVSPLQPSPQQGYVDKVAHLYSPSSPLCHSLCCHNFSGFLAGRETREGWPLLTVETEVNGNSKRQMKRGSFLVGSLSLSCRYKRFFVLPWLLYSAQYKIFFSSSYIISIPLSPSASKLGRQPCWVACLLVRVSVVKFGCHYFISPISLHFIPTYYTRTAPDDENFSLFL